MIRNVVAALDFVPARFFIARMTETQGKIALRLRAKGFSVESTCKALKISIDAFYKWKRQHDVQVYTGGAKLYRTL